MDHNNSIDGAMNRREFLKVSVMGIGSLFAANVLSSCGAAVTTGVGGAAVGVAGAVAGKTVSQYLIEFAMAIGTRVIATQFEAWLSTLSANNRQYVKDRASIMVEHGFVNYNTPIYHINEAIFYGVGHYDGFNACAPFFSQQGVALVEGPALMGITLAGQNWSSRAVSAGDGLVPVKVYQPDGSKFEANFPATFNYATNAGSLSMDYTANTQEKKGLISLVAEQDNGGVLHGQDYLITWT